MRPFPRGEIQSFVRRLRYVAAAAASRIGLFRNSPQPFFPTRCAVVALVLLITFSFVLTPASSRADVLWTNPITGTAPGQTNPYTNGQTVAPNVTVSGIGLGSGVNGTTANDRYTANNWHSPSLDADDYFTFTLTPDSGYAINFDAFLFTLQRTGTGPTNFSMAYGIGTNGVTNTIGGMSVGTSVTNAQPHNIDLTSFSALEGVTESITFNIYGWGASSAAGTLSVNDFAFTGDVTSSVFWAPGASGGGTGTWSSAGTNWSPAAGTQGSHTQSTEAPLIFGNTAGTVTVSGTVIAEHGLEFRTSGYTITGGTAISLAGATMADNTIKTDANVGATINTKLTGTTGLTKSGTGTLTLGGENDYTGGTLISAGRLVGTTTSLQGNITNSAALTFHQSTNGTYTGNISGIGSLTKDGAGTVTLDGASTYTGGTIINEGTLKGDTNSLRGNISVATNAAVEFGFTATGTNTYSNNISGEGSFIKSGASTLTLSGTNTHTGGTIIQEGRITTTVANLQGNISVATNASINFNQHAQDGTYAGNITGNGFIVKNGSATLTLTGTNNVIGIQVNGGVGGTGTLIGNTESLVARSITNNGTLAFDQDVSGNFAGRLAGTGTLIKAGIGSVTFTGSLSNSFSGNTLIEAGTLVLKKDDFNNRAISGSSVTVGLGGTLLLEAIEQIQDTTDMVLDGGTFRTGLDAGNSETLGTLTLSRSSTIDLGTGSHEIHFADSSSIDWDGTLTIDGWTFAPQQSGTQGRIFFAGAALTEAQLAKIQFTGYVPGAMLLGTGEIVPTAIIPEANPLWAAPLLALLAVWKTWKRRKRRELAVGRG